MDFNALNVLVLGNRHAGGIVIYIKILKVYRSK